VVLEERIAEALNVKAVHSWKDEYEISHEVDMVYTAVDWYAGAKAYNVVGVYVVDDAAAYNNECAIAVFEDPKDNSFNFYEVYGEDWSNSILCEYAGRNEGDITFRKQFFQHFGQDPLTGSDSWERGGHDQD
jgi:hypothetical protein